MHEKSKLMVYPSVVHIIHDDSTKVKERECMTPKFTFIKDSSHSTQAAVYTHVFEWLATLAREVMQTEMTTLSD